MTVFHKKQDYLNVILLFIISLILVSDLFLNRGEPVTFDGPTHLTNMAMFYKSIKQGQLHVTWTDEFANYGMPLGIMAQQTTSYLGAWINFLTNDIVLSYNLVLLIGAFLSCLFFCLFLRLYFKPTAALAATILFNFAPYRIINIYIRGAVPEFFASVFLPLILIGIYWFLAKKNYWGLILITISFALLILTHPFMMVIYALIIIPYLIFYLLSQSDRAYKLVIVGLAFFGGFLIASYFIIPLAIEMHYFYYGRQLNHYAANHFLTFKNFFDPRWFYYYKNDIGPRGHFMKTGVIEIGLLVIGYWLLVIGKLKNDKLIKVLLFSSLVIIFFLIKPSEFIYKSFPLLGNIQHPWRMLSAFIFIPPIVLAYFLRKTNKNFIVYAIIFIICLSRFPQLYGKNYTIYPQSRYFFTTENLHGTVLNTVWTGPTNDYPIKKDKGEIIEGKGKIVFAQVKNNNRIYRVNGETNLRMVDYTFYFPGWKVYVDGQPVAIEFQDPTYRGVITYQVPKGNHTIQVKFEDTKVRLLGKIVSIASLTSLFVIIIYILKIKNQIAN